MKDRNRVFLKVGTGSLFGKTEETDSIYLKEDQMDGLVWEVSEISQKFDVLLVSSGAVAMGAIERNLSKIPEDLELKRQLAGIGQPLLMEEYRRRFNEYGITTAQCLVTYRSLKDEEERRDLSKLQEGYFKNRILSIYNYNDPSSSEEINLDNDDLVKELAILLNADLVVMLSNNVDGFGRGGGDSKLRAKKILEENGIPVEILRGVYVPWNPDYPTRYEPRIKMVLSKYFDTEQPMEYCQ